MSFSLVARLQRRASGRTYIPRRILYAPISVSMFCDGATNRTPAESSTCTFAIRCLVTGRTGPSSRRARRRICAVAHRRATYRAAGACDRPCWKLFHILDHSKVQTLLRFLENRARQGAYRSQQSLPEAVVSRSCHVMLGSSKTAPSESISPISDW